MANEPPPPGMIPLTALSVSEAHTLASIALFFAVLSTIVFAARVYTRTTPTVHLGLDDWVACFAFILTLLDAAATTASVRFALGKNPRFIPASELAYIGQLAVASSFLGAWSIAMIKISVACLFLRLKRTKAWRAFLFAMIATQIVTALFLTIMHATRFIPMSSMWAPDLAVRMRGTVWSPRAFSIGMSISGSCNILTDVVFSILPIFFLWDVQRPRREKIVVGMLMACGLVASAASIAKTVGIQTFGATNDILAEGIRIAMWSVLEEQLGIIVACVPTLNTLFKKVLGRFGLLTTMGSKANVSGHRAYSNRHSTIHPPAGKGPFFSLDDQSIELNGSERQEGKPSSGVIEQITEISVTSDSRV